MPECDESSLAAEVARHLDGLTAFQAEESDRMVESIATLLAQSRESQERILKQALKAQLEAFHKTNEQEISELKAEMRELQATLHQLTQAQLASSQALGLDSNE
eukprot:COSAG02_NODE_765_length_17396_cov_16.796786_5_plen_104_part_00